MLLCVCTVILNRLEVRLLLIMYPIRNASHGIHACMMREVFTKRYLQIKSTRDKPALEKITHLPLFCLDLMPSFGTPIWPYSRTGTVEFVHHK